MTDDQPCTCRLQYGPGNDPACPRHGPDITISPKPGIRTGPRVRFDGDGSIHIDFNVKPPGSFTPAPGAGSFGRSTSPGATAATGGGGVSKPGRSVDPLVIWEQHDTDWAPAIVHVFGDKVRLTIGGDGATRPGRYVDLAPDAALNVADRIRGAATFIKDTAP